MNKSSIITAALALTAVAASAQPSLTVSSGGAQSFQFMAGGPGPDTVRVLSFEGMGGRTVAGHPVSATEERHTLQVLGDGTRIEKTSTDKFYRDDQGRTRIEREDGTVMINDPVAGVAAEIGANGNTVHTLSRELKTAGARAVSAEVANKLAAEQQQQFTAAISTTRQPPVNGDIALAKVKAEAATKEENLGYLSVNGVTAQGFRTNMTIPVGQIGNDRPIQIVSERWYSPDLQMNVKTSNSDPRFGETTYQLTNIVQGAQDPTLFQVPADSK